MSLFCLGLAVLRRDLLAAARRGSEWSNPLVFFIMVCALFPLGIGPQPERLAELAPGILWVGLAGLIVGQRYRISQRLRRWHARADAVEPSSSVPTSDCKNARALAAKWLAPEFTFATTRRFAAFTHGGDGCLNGQLGVRQRGIEFYWRHRRRAHRRAAEGRIVAVTNHSTLIYSCAYFR